MAAAAVTVALSLSSPDIAAAAEPQPSAASSDATTVIVRGEPGGQPALAAAVTAAGGSVTRELGLIDSVVATVPAHRLADLAAAPGVLAATEDAPLRLSSAAELGPEESPEESLEESTATSGTSPLASLTETVRADEAWQAGYSGSGVDVAVLDSGVVPVDGLSAPGKVVNGPDLSFDTRQSQVRHLDGYGHGTHMAGIVAGRDNAAATPVRAAGDRFTGVAPDARVVNVKVADSNGATDVSQVIAGLDWIVEHGQDRDLDIRVVNLSFGTDGVQNYRLDPLAYAVERAWHAGIVVVVAAGNEGFGTPKLNNPAYDPYVIAVGGSDGKGTESISDDVVAPWSSRGDADRRPDLVAPGQAVVSLRSPGSQLDQTHPTARIGDRFFRGSGTSQATAVISGAAAILLQQRPNLRPDQVKALLTSTARDLPLGDAGQGAGLLDVRAALAAATPSTRQSWPRAQGTGSLELARGSVRVAVDGTPLIGELSIFGTVWSLVGSVLDLLGGDNAWSGGGWSGNSWTGNSWTGGSWKGNSWTGNSWTGNSWTGNSWTGNSWTGNSWTGNSWTGNSWTGNSWTSASW